ncbi:MAG TPA: ABC transporter substrate-binding protein, partial [Sinomonas sp.]|nr:ABC transporter substrate-binding protein [Sinomonas sp.]
MSQSIDVGSVLGGRYKVTSSIVESHDGDLVLDGVDQILNRPVSILVSAPHNAEQLAQSAREVATGERHVGIQVLDLGTSHGATYLITNHAQAADLLDLIVAQEEPYVEPFFTESLGSEIFGEARSREPETYDGLYDHGQHDYIQYSDAESESQAPSRPEPPVEQRPAPARPVPPPPAAPPRSSQPEADRPQPARPSAQSASAGPAATQPQATQPQAPQREAPQREAPQREA